VRHVIIEGPDGAGKTTLARQLCHQLTLGYHHEGPPPTNVPALEHYARLLVEAKRPTLFDRLHLGETVYGPLLRGGSRLDARGLRLMNRLIRGQGTTVVLCHPLWETTLRNTKGRKELIEDVDIRQRAYDCWTMVAASSRFNVDNTMVHDYEAWMPKRLRFDWVNLPDGVVGSPTASHLIVGEQPNGDIDLPFFGAAHSSAYLDEVLFSAGYTEDSLALTNALSASGVVRDLAFIVSQMPHLKTVIPLGRVAEAQCARQRLPGFVSVTPLPHPQYRKRFHLARTEDYVRMFQEVR
jgi:hypothetical protein